MMEAVSLPGENKGSALMRGRRVLCCNMQLQARTENPDCNSHPVTIC